LFFQKDTFLSFERVVDYYTILKRLFILKFKKLLIKKKWYSEKQHNSFGRILFEKLTFSVLGYKNNREKQAGQYWQTYRFKRPFLG
jgi:hypothetical protein